MGDTQKNPPRPDTTQNPGSGSSQGRDKQQPRPGMEHDADKSKKPNQGERNPDSGMRDEESHGRAGDTGQHQDSQRGNKPMAPRRDR